jgi:uncharacterized protein YjbI with pentapeptide repeats
LREVEFEDCDFLDASLRGAAMDRSVWYRSKLNGADLTGARVEGVEFHNVKRGPADGPMPGWIVVEGHLIRDDAATQSQ